jgi:L-Lysine epsilon oxidase N-terminal/L-lysine epsilon oxidase C-terminal domain
MTYRIFPPIGIARIGNSPEFFVGPETPGSLGVDIRADGTEVPVERFKDAAYRVRRQAARFRLFEFDDASPAGRPAVLPAGATVEWKVSLANKKDAVVRDSSPIVERPNQPPPPLPRIDPARAHRAIGADGVAPPPGTPPVTLTGTYLTGTSFETRVVLGDLLTDGQGNLLVLGGRGISASPEGRPIGDEPLGGGFYANAGWYDDVSDGQVTAEVRIPGRTPVTVEPAAIIVAPPDFAPATAAIVTLYDVLLQVAIAHLGVALPGRPSFSRDIWPLLRRAAGLRWVNPRPVWTRFSTDWAELARTDTTGPVAQRRRDHAEWLRSIGPTRALANFSLRPWQLTYIEAWEHGEFDSDFDGQIPGAGQLTPEHLTRTVLDAAAGQGFFPGIEAGIVLTNPALYATPFRISQTVMPGTLTALMALPWQADFYDCSGGWWPSQRPDHAAQAASPVSFAAWVRPTDDSETPHRDLVANVMRLGMIAAEPGSAALIETGRDPLLP